MKKFRFFTILSLLLVAVFTMSACTMPWEENGCWGTEKKESEETSEVLGPTTQLAYAMVKKGTYFEPTVSGTAKFKFCPERITLTMDDVEQEVKPYTTVYAPLSVDGSTEYFYILSFNNVLYYDTLGAGEHKATINAYKDGEITETLDTILRVGSNMHYFQNFNPTTGETLKGMNENRAPLTIYDNFNDDQTVKNYFEKSGMATDGLGQRTYGIMPVEKFGSTVNLNSEGSLTYLITSDVGYTLETVNLKSYVTLCHAGSADDYSKADIKIQISYDNVNFEDVYSLRSDTEIADTWIDGKSYLGAKGPGVVNGISYFAGAIDGMTEIPTESPAGADCRFYIDQEIAVKGYVNTVYVRILCSNFAMTDKPLYAVPTRIHNVQLTASQI